MRLACYPVWSVMESLVPPPIYFSSGYDACMVMFMALSGGAALFSLWLIFEDFRKGLILSKSVKSPSVSDESAESQVVGAFPTHCNDRS